MKIKNREIEAKILELAKFIGFEEPNVDEIIKNSSLEATIERRKAKCEAAGYPFYEIICYRKVSKSKKVKENICYEFFRVKLDLGKKNYRMKLRKCMIKNILE